MGNGGRDKELPRLPHEITPGVYLTDMLDVHLAFEGFGMLKYVNHFPVEYHTTLFNRVPSFAEAQAIIKHTLEGDDKFIDALGFRLAELQIEGNIGMSWVDFLNRPESKCLKEAMYKAVEAIVAAKNQWAAHTTMNVVVWEFITGA